MTTLAELLATSTPIVADGAMGTQLQEAGLDDGGAPELWNVERPDVVEAVLAAYVAAGSQAITSMRLDCGMSAAPITSIAPATGFN